MIILFMYHNFYTNILSEMSFFISEIKKTNILQVLDKYHDAATLERDEH